MMHVKMTSSKREPSRGLIVVSGNTNDLTVKARHEAEGGFPRFQGLFNNGVENRLRVAR
jgi:hypothetical protein